MQLYKSVSLKDAWWNVCCSGCGKPIADDPWRKVKITWSEILGIAIELWGKPDGFFVRDFLISMEFLKGQVLLTFCSQGSRRGEVQISVSAGDNEAEKLLRAFMDRVRAVIESVEDEADYVQEDYYDDEYLDEEDCWEEPSF